MSRSSSPQAHVVPEKEAFIALPDDSDDSDHEEADEEGFASDWTDEFTSPTRLARLLEQAKISMEKAARASLKKGHSSDDEEDENADERNEELDILLFEDAESKEDAEPSIFASTSSLPSSSALRSASLADYDAHAGFNHEILSKLDVALPAPPQPAFEVDAKGKRVTKKDKRERKTATAGSNWYDLPAPPAAELPKLYREVEAMRLRNQLDPKRFYRKDESEGRGIKGLPKYFAIGTVVATPAPFGGAAPGGDNLPRAARKRTMVDELVDDAEARRYAKRKFNEFQSVREAKGRRTLHDKQARRARKW